MDREVSIKLLLRGGLDEFKGIFDDWDLRYLGNIFDKKGGVAIAICPPFVKK